MKIPKLLNCQDFRLKAMAFGTPSIFFLSRLPKRDGPRCVASLVALMRLYRTESTSLAL